MPEGQAMTTLDGSVKYVRVRCVVCGWEDRLRADLADAGQMGIYCDRCDGAQAAELIHPDAPGERLPPNVPDCSALHSVLSVHVGHAGLYLSNTPDGTIELRCFARTHGGSNLLLLSALGNSNQKPK